MAHDLSNQLQTLYARYGHLPGVRIELHKELIAIHVENNQAEATVFLQGAQLSHYRRHSHHHSEPAIIWCSDACTYSAGQSLRGGIPVCWPWFGELARNHEQVRNSVVTDSSVTALPAHGLVRNREWCLDEVTVLGDDLTQVTLSLELAENDEPSWPYRCSLQLTIQVGAELKSSLKVSNHSPQALCFSSALHSYLAVADITNVQIKSLDGVSYVDALQDFQGFRQQGNIHFQQETDRIYYQAPALTTIRDQSWHRYITLRSEGSHSTVVWNPWIEKGRRLSCFNEEDYRSMVCVETCNAHTDFVCLQPQQSHTLAVTIFSQPIEDC